MIKVFTQDTIALCMWLNSQRIANVCRIERFSYAKYVLINECDKATVKRYLARYHRRVEYRETEEQI